MENNTHIPKKKALSLGPNKMLSTIFHLIAIIFIITSLSSCDLFSVGGSKVLTISNKTSSEIVISKVTTGASIETPKTIDANSSITIEDSRTIYVGLEARYLGQVYVVNSGESSTDYSKYVLEFSDTSGNLECYVIHKMDGKYKAPEFFKK